MKLDAKQVQQIRTLARSGFSTRSIANAFGMTPRQIWSIVKGRCWKFLAFEPVELPVLASDSAVKLRLRAAKKLTYDEQVILNQYRDRLTASIELTAEREGFALRLIRSWTAKKSPLPRKSRQMAMVTE